MAVVVLELDPQAPDVAVDDVALGHEVGAPDGVEDLLAGHDPPATAGEQVEQALLDARQVDDRVAGADLAVDDVDLDLAEPDPGTIGRSVPDARRVITIERASSSSGEKGIVRMSSTPRSKARSFVLRSPRRVSPRTGVRARVIRSEAPSRPSSAVLSSWSMSIIAICGCQSRRIASASARLRAARTTNRPWLRVSLDQVHDEPPVVEHQRPAGLDHLRTQRRRPSRPTFACDSPHLKSKANTCPMVHELHPASISRSTSGWPGAALAGAQGSLRIAARPPTERDTRRVSRSSDRWPPPTAW